MITLDLSILNQKGTPMFNSDLFANRPAAGIVGRIFISTDTQTIFRDTGTTWDTIGGGGGTIAGTIAAGQVAFGTAANTIGGTNNLFYDSSNQRLGIGTNTPLNNLHISQNANGSVYARISNISNGIAALSGFYITNNLNIGSAFYVTSSNYTGNPNAAVFSTDGLISGGIKFETSNANAPITFASGTGTDKMRIFNTGNILIQNGGTFTDTGQRLQVNGDSLLSGITSITPTTITGSSSATSLSITQTWNTTGNPALIYSNLTNTASGINSSLLRFDVGSVQTFNISTEGLIKFGAVTSASAGISGGNPSNGNILVGGQALSLFMSGGTYTGYEYHFVNYTSSRVATSGTNGSIRTAVTFNPTSGTATYAIISLLNQINQTGGANGITRGLYVNPTLTAAADWRSIEWNNNTGWGLYGVGTAPSYFAGNVQIGSTTPIASNIKLQVTGTGQINDTRTYVSGTAISFATVKDLTINSAISGSSGIINNANTGLNIIGASISVPSSTTFANLFAYNQYQFSSAGLTLTATQPGTTGIRTISQITTQNVFTGTNSGTITHVSSLQLNGFYNNNTGTSTPVITNAYQLLINDTGEFAHTFSFTNRWAIYQPGINDRNYLAGNLLLNSTTDTGQILQVNGAIRVNGQASGTAGGASGNHLIINVDGTQYKIALLNP